ncbi:aspartate 1-decarboxylase [Bradyrhizobium diazoefficiens]|uniref:aspartate 1-decarboxylase n=1 Tax=Bradyrhizobium diazoefficiens TaxID=1355477 RepID=UPI003515E65A
MFRRPISTIDPDKCHEAGILPREFLQIWNKNSGARILAHVIFGESGSRWRVLAGAAARTCQPGDQIIVCSSTHVDVAQITRPKRRVLASDRPQDCAERDCFEIRCGAGEVKTMPLRAAESN